LQGFEVVINRVVSLGVVMMFAALATAGAQTPQMPMSLDVSPQQITQQTEADPAGDPALIDKGKATYAERCSHCHGFGMVNAGTIAPNLRKFPHDQARFVATVKLGKNNKMPPWGDVLSDDQIHSLWAYVSSQSEP
jgi:mono/diheme cytochrome c family protein